MIRPVRNLTPSKHPPFIRNVFEVYEGDAKFRYGVNLSPFLPCVFFYSPFLNKSNTDREKRRVAKLRIKSRRRWNIVEKCDEKFSNESLNNTGSAPQLYTLLHPHSISARMSKKCWTRLRQTSLIIIHPILLIGIISTGFATGYSYFISFAK